MAVPRSYNPRLPTNAPPTLCNALFCTLLLRLEQGTSSKISPQQRSDIGGHSLLKPDPFIQKSHGAGYICINSNNILGRAIKLTFWGLWVERENGWGSS